MYRYCARALCTLVAVTLVSACDSPSPGRSSGMFGSDDPSRSGGVSRGENHGFVDDSNPGAMQRGTDDFLGDDGSRGGASRAVVVPDGPENVQLSLVNASIEAAAKAAGLEYRFLPVSGAGQTPEQISAFAALLDELPRPLLAFCRSGARSTNLFVQAQRSAGT